MTGPQEERTPILVGSGQFIQRDADPQTAKGPVDMMMEAVSRAGEDAGLGKQWCANVDSLSVVECITGIYSDLMGLLAERLDMRPADRIYTTTGGNKPQALVNEKAQALAEGRIKLAVLCGAEALQSLVRAIQNGIRPDWIDRDGAELGISRPEYEATADYEMPYDIQLPIIAYPLVESALRAQYGHGLEEHQTSLGRLLSPFSHTAAQNPYAWFRQGRSPEEISKVSGENRYVGFPYTKFMNSIIQVDQSAAVIMTTTGNARRWGIPESRWVYLHGCGDAQDHLFLTERENFFSSAPLRMIGQKALEMAGLSMDDVDYFDLYSAFPSAVQMALDSLGLRHDDARPFTVTGGLPYHGGPGSNYMMHSIATMMNTVRDHPGATGLCNGLGWYFTRHSIGVYSTDAIEKTWTREDPAAYQAELDKRPKATVSVEAQGEGTVEAYTVFHGREGPERAIVLGRLDDGRRFLGETHADADVFSELMTHEAVGRPCRVSSGTKLNVVEIT